MFVKLPMNLMILVLQNLFCKGTILLVPVTCRHDHEDSQSNGLLPVFKLGKISFPTLYFDTIKELLLLPI